MKLSYSQLNEYATCSWKYALKREERVPEAPSWALVGGKAVHAAIADATRTPTSSGLDADAAAESFAGHLRKEAATAQTESGVSMRDFKATGRATKANPNKEDAAWWQAEGTRQVRQFAASQGTPFLPGVIHEVEKPFSVEIGQNEVVGYIDAVVEREDGTVIPRDYKSGSRAPEGDLQLATYAEALRLEHDVPPTGGEYVMTRNMSTIHKPLDPSVRDDLARSFDALGKAREHKVYIPNPGIACSWCAVAHACRFKKD